MTYVTDIVLTQEKVELVARPSGQKFLIWEDEFDYTLHKVIDAVVPRPLRLDNCRYYATIASVHKSSYGRLHQDIALDRLKGSFCAM